jgi:hypothetical protein
MLPVVEGDPMTGKHTTWTALAAWLAWREDKTRAEIEASRKK